MTETEVRMRRVRNVCLVLAFACAVLAVVLSVHPTVLAAPGQVVPPVAPDQWVSLGPIDIEVGVLAVSPGWPADHFIYAAGYAPRQGGNTGAPSSYLGRRSYDGGATWESVPSAPRTLQTVTGVLGGASGRTLFGYPAYSDWQVPGELLRSTDDGQTWTTIFAAHVNHDATPVLSPSFATDHLMLMIDGGDLLRSRDAGDTWETLGSWPGWGVHQVAFSPDFATDQTLLLTVSAGTFPVYIVPETEEAPLRAALHGDADVLKSMDGGVTWASASIGLALDGAPYRHVEALTISPTFAQDHTIFAYAWGQGQPDNAPGPAPSIRPALFASQDGGASWQFRWEPFPPDQWRLKQWTLKYYVHPLSLVLSPRFSANGIALMAVHTQGVSPHDGHCRLYRSSDSGITWSLATPQIPFSEASYHCDGITLSGRDGRTAYWKETRDGYGWARSLDGGATIQTLHGGGPQEGQVAILSDGTVIEPWQGTLRMLPPGAGAPTP